MSGTSAEKFKQESYALRDEMRCVMKDFQSCTTEEETREFLLKLLNLAEEAKKKLIEKLETDEAAAEEAKIPGALRAAEKIVARASMELRHLTKSKEDNK